MNYIDLNIDNYSLENLTHFFGINDTDEDDSLTEERVLGIKKTYEAIVAESRESEEKKKQLMNFIADGIDRLLYSIRTATNMGEPDSTNVLKRNTLRYNPTQQTNNMGDLITQDIQFSQNGSHQVVTPQPVPFVYTSPDDNFGGVLNPLKKRIITKQVCFDTIHQDNYASTNTPYFNFILKEPLKHVISMQLVSIELPRMWYTYSKDNENIKMVINMYNQQTIPFVSVPIELPEGNYNTSDFTTTMNNIFKYDPNLKYLLFYIDQVNGRSVIVMDPEIEESPTNPSSPNYSPIFYYEVVFVNDNQDLRSTLGWSMGFRSASYTVYPTPTTISYTYRDTGAMVFYGFLQSESTFGANLENYLFLEVDDFNNNYVANSVVSQNFNSFIGQPILGRVSLSTVPFTIVENNKSDLIDRTREYFGPVTITKIKVSLLNKYGYPVDLLQNDYSFVLEFKLLYAK